MRLFSYPWWTHGWRYRVWLFWWRRSYRRVGALEAVVGSLADRVKALEDQ